MFKRQLFLFFSSLVVVFFLSSCNTTLEKAPDHVARVLQHEDFDTAILFLRDERIQVDLINPVIHTSDALTAVAFKTSGSNTVLQALVQDARVVSVVIISSEPSGNVKVVNPATSTTFAVSQSDLQVMSSLGYDDHVSSDQLEQGSTLVQILGLSNNLEEYLIPAQACKVPASLTYALRSAEDARRAADIDLAAASAALVYASYQLGACVAGPAACAWAVSAYTAATANLARASFAHRSATNAVKSAQAAISEWRKQNC